MMDDRVNILLVDDQPAKLLSYEVILRDLGENLVKAASARDALEQLLKKDIAVVLIDVCMPELDGFQLAAMIREHPRFQQTAIIFISAIHLTDVDRVRGYEMGAVDYVPVPVIPEVLRAKVRVFAELYRKTRQLEQLNHQLEERVVQRTAELEASTVRLLQSERLRSFALAAGQMGSWEWDAATGESVWDEGQCRIFGVDPQSFAVTVHAVRPLIHADDWVRLLQEWKRLLQDAQTFQTEFRVQRPDGELRWCIGSAAASVGADGRITHVSGVIIDITDRKEAEERQSLLAREVDHRARNALAVVQAIVRLTRAKTVDGYVSAVEGRILALSRAHMLLSHSRWQGADLGKLVDEELGPYRTGEDGRVAATGPNILLYPATAQALALALHELATNAAKHGALSSATGRVRLAWELRSGSLALHWAETGGPSVEPPAAQGYGTRVISASIERQLGGRAKFDWRREGLHCTMSIPRSDKVEEAKFAGNGQLAGDRKHAVSTPKIVKGNRILLVEDEALVAMMMRDSLVELGFCVVGPFDRAAEALARATDDQLDAAILDVNLGGDLIYPVAQRLADRDVPFVFVTGYDTESIDPRFAYVPVLQKPIEREVLQGLFVSSANGAGKPTWHISIADHPAPALAVSHTDSPKL
jgi:PAS domain S-box-containing protein